MYSSRLDICCSLFSNYFISVAYFFHGSCGEAEAYVILVDVRERTCENYGKYAYVHGEKRARAKLNSVCGSVGGPKQMSL